MGVSFETYLRRCWDVQRDVVTTSPQRLVAGWVGSLQRTSLTITYSLIGLLTLTLIARIRLLARVLLPKIELTELALTVLLRRTFLF